MKLTFKRIVNEERDGYKISVLEQGKEIYHTFTTQKWLELTIAEISQEYNIAQSEIINLDNITAQQTISILADISEGQGAEPNDDNGIVKNIITQYGLSFNAWLCVCTELADRIARKEGYKNQLDRAGQKFKQSVIFKDYKEKQKHTIY